MGNFGVFGESNSCFCDEVAGHVSGNVNEIAGKVVDRNKESYEDGDDKKVGGDDWDGQLHETFRS